MLPQTAVTGEGVRVMQLGSDPGHNWIAGQNPHQAI